MTVCEVCGEEVSRRARRFCSQRCHGAAIKAAHPTCLVASCADPARGAHGLCNLHRQRVRKHGDPDHVRWPDALTRIMSKIRFGDCWEWQAALFQRSGYGLVSLDGGPRLAHRVVYELLVGPIPEGLQLDHLCRNRACVNPAHLEPVTGRENIRRGHAARKVVHA